MLLCAATACGLISGIWFLSDMGQASRQISIDLQRLRIDGIATTSSELHRPTSISDSENAALAYDKAYSRFRAMPPADRGVFISAFRAISSGGKLTSSDEAAARGALRDFRPVKNELRQAGELPGFDFKRKWDLGPMMLLPDCANASMTSRALLLEAKFDSEDGAPLESLKSLDILAKSAAHIMKEPLILALCVAGRIESSVWKQLGEILDKFGDRKPVLDACRQVVEDLGPPNDIRHILGGEIVFLRAAAERLSSLEFRQLLEGYSNDPSNPYDPPLSVRLSSYNVVRKTFEARALHTWCELANRLPADSTDYAAINRAFNFVWEKHNRDQGWQNALFKAMFDSLNSTGEVMAKYEAQRRIILCAIDALRSRLTRGRCPDRLVSSGTTALDPFTNKPLAFVPYADGFMIYSFGPNGKDDSGDPVGTTWTTLPTDDLPFTYP